MKVENRGLSFLFLAVFMLAAVEGCKQEKAPEVRLRGDKFDPVRSLIDETIRKHNIASVAIAAAKDGEIVWEEAFGWADREEQIPATPQSIYALASISKSFTATGLMVLVERGLVDLDRPINAYLGEAKLVSYVGDSTQPTVRHVLQHTAGLPSHYNLFFANEAMRPPDQDESIRRYGIIVDQPGREFVYSNFGYGVLDRVIARVSGKSYAEFMKAEVFAPLDLTHTSVLVDSTLQAHTVRHYDAQGNLVPALDFDHRGASAVYSSVHDLIRYGMFHLQSQVPGQKRILSEQTIDMMHRPSDFTMPEEKIGETRIGLGWAIVDLRDLRFLIVTGGMPGTVTRLALIPEENAAVAIMANSGIGETYSPWDIEWQTFAALIPGFPKKPALVAEKEPAAPLPAELLGEWRGSIKTYQGDLAAKLSIRDSRNIMLEIDGKKARPIRVRNHLGGIRFRDGVFQAPFFGSIPTGDLQSRKAGHVLFLRLRRRDDTLSGVVAAVAMNRMFWLPHWMELRTIAAKQFTKQEASELVNTYTSVLASGDSARTLEFWSSESVDDPDFWNMHAFIGSRKSFSMWPEFLKLHTPRIDEVRSENDYAIIDLTWIVRDSSTAQNQPPRAMRFYIIQENGRWVFMNPIDILTRDWKSYESAYLVYHFPDEYRPEDHLHEIRANDQFFKKMLRFFNLDLTEKLHFYKARTARECGELILHPPANGYAVFPLKGTYPPPGAYKVISTSFYHPHEVAHCLAALAGIPHDNPIVTEGFAVALGGVAGATADITLQEARNLLEASKLLPLETLFALPVSEFLQKNYITYYESGSLIRFLHDRFGMGKLKEVCADLNQSSDAAKSMKSILGISISQLEKQLHEYLVSQKRENIGFSIPPAAIEIFSMKDSEKDDTGDGDYVYPKHRNFEKGVFDLRQFTVLKDKDNAYFKVRMSKLMAPISYGSSDEQFTPCIVIAINYGKNGARTVHRDCHGVQFPAGEGYDVKLNIGSAVSVSNNLGKVYYTTPDIVYEFVNKDESAIEVSIPISMIGEPEKDWQYFVGVGLASSRTMNFLYGGPMPVQQNHPVFISGGNFAYGNPAFIDILYPGSNEQARILSKYDVATNLKPIVKMVKPYEF